MELGDRELEQIGKYVQDHLEEWSRGKIVGFRTDREIELLERIVRVEEGLKAQAELMRQGFEQMEKRFEEVDKRFEVLQHYSDKRFSQLQWTIGIGFSLLAALLGVFHYL